MSPIPAAAATTGPEGTAGRSQVKPASRTPARCGFFVPALLGLLATAARAAPAEHRLDLPLGGAVTVLASAEWGGAAVRRAVVVVHGLGRNVAGYYAAIQRGRTAAGAEALLVAPHFRAGADPGGPDLLRWRTGGWMGGLPATGKVPASAFDVLDALLLRLSDKARYPALESVVLAGHSAGAQLVQRYAAVGRAAPPFRLRFVVANPSSYLWFGPDRPGPDLRPAPFAGAAACPGWNDWKYGLAGGLPPYVTEDAAALEARYAGREIVYLLGLEDTDPQQRDLDRSCAGLAEGPNRLARGRGFLAHLLARHGPLPGQTLHEVPGVAHQGARMLTSACGLAALFDAPASPAGSCE